MPSNIKQNVVFRLPRNFDERRAVADSCVRRLNLHIPALIDSFANTTDIAYTGWPDRLYVIDRDGRITYKSKPGPFGFEPAGVDEALKKL